MLGALFCPIWVAFVVSEQSAQFIVQLGLVKGPGFSGAENATLFGLR